jgi:hypothetical protein
MALTRRRCKIYISKVDWKHELETIRQMGENGATYVDIGKKYGVSRQRVKQVLARLIPEWNDIYGGVVRRRATADKWYDKWGDKSDSKLYKMQRLKFARKKANATKVGYTWSVSFGELEWPSKCPILGIELDYFAETRQENSPSFDRIDNNLGYDRGNVVILSWRANRIKNDGTPYEHRAIADYLEKTHT